MDTKSATILATGRTVNLPESEEQPVAAKPLTEIQIHAVDLSLKSSQSLPPYSQPLHFKDTHGLHCETKKANRGKKRRRSSMEGEEAADNITHTAVDPGVQKSNDSDSILPETDSIDTSGKETHSHSLVVLKDEIEEVCIGDSHGCWQGDSYPPVFLSKIKAEDKGSEVTSNDSDDVAEDAFGTIKEEHGDVVMDEVGLLAKDVTKEKTTVSERQVLDLTGIIKSNSLTGLSAELGQGMENCSCKNELSDSMPNSDEERNGKEEAGFPLVQDLGKRKEQRTNEPDTGTVDKENEVIQKMEGEEEALNLSLSQKAVRSHTPKMEKYAEDGTGSQSTLVMEVDEIMQREEDEEEEQDDDSQTLFDKEPAVVRVNVPDWAPKLSPASVSVHNSPTSSTAEDLDGLLLIDDQGIPYTLMPDGKKVIQVAQSKSCKASTLSQTKLKARRVEAKDSQTASSPDRDLPKKGVTEALTCPSSKERTPQLSTSGSAPKIVHLNNKPTSQTAVIAPASLSPSLSNLASQPVKILANPTSNILLVPSSHLPSPQSAKPTSNASLLTLSLPISLNPNPPSAPLFLVLSPLTASSTPPSSSSSKVNVIDSIPSPLLPSNMQSSASALVPLSSGKTVTGSSSPSSGSLLVDELNSGTPSTSIVGNGTGPISTPDSPSISSGNTRQPKPDLTSKTALPKLSRVIKSESPSNPDSTNVAANQTESSTSPVPISSSPVKSPESNSLRCTSTSSVCQTSKDSPPAPISDTLTDIFPFDQSHYERSGTPPPTAIFPTNHPKNFSLSSSCTRRILYCQYCPRAFYYLSDLERHSITHSQSKPYVCPLCNKAFKRSSHLERHKHIHTGQRNFICPICSKRFREAGELLRHQRVHTGEKPFQCPQCHMRFAERNTLRRHTKRKHHELNGHGDGEGMPGGQEESAEWYSCAVPDIDSDTEPDKD